ncbi:dihydrolipoamide acetyltransferase family protein [Pontibacillus salicampi]|uniref:Dihydrolipoamide acetyltransferase component of pyruvate dehydrogenase complex n=1 Tax=Pontibacillus salicampi TaxID=1449801 RepID=A0ABV6LK00_9BACI
MEVKLHDIGEGMTEAEVLHFFVKSGDAVKADDPLLEVQTDKMTAEIPAPANGRIEELLVEVGQTIEVGTTVLTMTSAVSPRTASSTEGPSPVEQSGGSKRQPSSTTVTLPKRNKPIMASPFTRKIARDQGVNIEEVKGSGPSGRILDEDIYRYLESQESEQKEASVTSEEMDGEAVQAIPSTRTSEPETIPFKGRRKQIAKKMTQSLHTIAHCTHFEEVDVTTLLEWKEQSKAAGKNFSLSAFFVKAVSIALKDYPIFNARLDEEEELIHLNRDHHIGLATDTEDGLIVPVIPHVEQKSIYKIQTEMKELTAKALNNQLSRQDISGGTFTISNVGPLKGSTGATPIINYPETGLMAFHKTKQRPAVVNNEIVIRSMMNVSMTFDHRVADGGTAVQFTNRLVDIIESPQLLALEMI